MSIRALIEHGFIDPEITVWVAEGQSIEGILDDPLDVIYMTRRQTKRGEKVVTDAKPEV